MASLASRYTQVSVVMKVHVWALYEFQQTFLSHSARRKSAHLEVLIWNVFLLSLRINPASFARPFTFSVSHTIEYDASTTDMGVLVWKGDLVGPCTMLGFCRVTLPICCYDGFQFQEHL